MSTLGQESGKSMLKKALRTMKTVWSAIGVVMRTKPNASGNQNEEVIEGIMMTSMGKRMMTDSRINQKQANPRPVKRLNIYYCRL